MNRKQQGPYHSQNLLKQCNLVYFVFVAFQSFVKSACFSEKQLVVMSQTATPGVSAVLLSPSKHVGAPAKHQTEAGGSFCRRV